MFEAFMIFTAIMSAGATVYASHEEAKAAKRAQEAADAEARREKMRTEEEVARMRRQNIKAKSDALVKIAASGVKLEGTPAGYMTELEWTGQEDVRWLQRQGAWRVEAIKSQGRLAYQEGMGRSRSTMISGASKLSRDLLAYNYYYGGKDED